MLLVVGLVALVLVAGGFLYLNNANDAAKMEEAKMMDEKTRMGEGVMIDKEEDMMKKDSEVKEADAMVEDKGTMIDKNEDAMMKKDDAIKGEDAMMKKDDSAMMQKAGTYTAYSASALATAQSGKTVLFFAASWCPTCRTADADIVANVATIPSGVTILKADYDKEVALKQKYGVTTQHTFVEVDKNGALVQKWNGGNLAGIVAKVK